MLSCVSFQRKVASKCIYINRDMFIHWPANVMSNVKKIEYGKYLHNVTTYDEYYVKKLYIRYYGDTWELGSVLGKKLINIYFILYSVSNN